MNGTCPEEERQKASHPCTFPISVTGTMISVLLWILHVGIVLGLNNQNILRYDNDVNIGKMFISVNSRCEQPGRVHPRFGLNSWTQCQEFVDQNFFDNPMRRVFWNLHLNCSGSPINPSQFVKPTSLTSFSQIKEGF